MWRQYLIFLNILINHKSRMLRLQRTSVDRFTVIRLCIRLKPWIFPIGLEQTTGHLSHPSRDTTPSPGHWAAGLGMKARGQEHLCGFPGVLVIRLAVSKEDAGDPPWSGKRHPNIAKQPIPPGLMESSRDTCREPRWGKPALKKPALRRKRHRKRYKETGKKERMKNLSHGDRG